MQGHIKAVGLIYAILGGLGFLSGIIVLFIFIFTGGIVAVAGEDPDAGIAVGILTAVGTFVAILAFISAIPSLLAGIGLLRRKPWAKLWTIIASVLSLFGFPLGTALGIWALWMVLQPEFDREMAQPQPPL